MLIVTVLIQYNLLLTVVIIYTIKLILTTSHLSPDTCRHIRSNTHTTNDDTADRDLVRMCVCVCVCEYVDGMCVRVC